MACFSDNNQPNVAKTSRKDAIKLQFQLICQSKFSYHPRRTEKEFLLVSDYLWCILLTCQINHWSKHVLIIFTFFTKSNKLDSKFESKFEMIFFSKQKSWNAIYFYRTNVLFQVPLLHQVYDEMKIHHTVECSTLFCHTLDERTI